MPGYCSMSSRSSSRMVAALIETEAAPSAAAFYGPDRQTFSIVSQLRPDYP